MADSVISDAIPGIQDEGLPNISDGSEDWGSAGLRMMLSQAVDSDSYVRSDSELTFTGHDGTNDTVDVTAGVAYLDLTGETVDVQSSFGGSSPPAYDLTLPTLPAIPVIVPTTVTDVSLQDSTLSSVWLAFDTDGTGPGSAGSVYIRSDDTGSVTAPTHPNVELGQANPDNASADSLSNRFGSPTFNTVTSELVDTGQVDVTEETFVKATRTSDTGTVTAGNWTNAFDTEAEDNRDELNPSIQFVPDETGWYDIEAVVRLQGGASGDILSIRVQNITDSNTVAAYNYDDTSGDREIFFINTIDFSAGDAYEIQARNVDSDFTVLGNPVNTNAVIKKSVVHP